MLRRPTRYLLPTLLPLAFGLGLRLWLLRHAPRITGDTLIYGAIARNWLQHGTYGFATIEGTVRPTLIRLPGYPLFLAVCFRLFGVERYAAVMLLQAVIELAACLLLSRLSARLWGAPAGHATLWLAALCPFTACYTAAPLTETLTLAFMVVALDALDRWQRGGANFNRWLLVLSIALAYSLLLRPEQGLLAAAILPAMLWMGLQRTGRRAGALLPAATAALLTLLPLFPWTLRNAHTFHVFEPLAPRQATDPGEPFYPGFGHWFRTWGIDYASTEDVYWNYDGSPIPFTDLPNRAFDTPAQRAETAALLADYNQSSNANPPLDARFESLARQRLAAHPSRRIWLPVARLLDMILRPRTETLGSPLDWWHLRDHRAASLFAAAFAALNLTYFALAAWGARLWYRRASHRALLWTLLATLALRAGLLLTLDNSEPRYTLEFFPILFLLAAVPFATGWLHSSSHPS